MLWKKMLEMKEFQQDDQILFNDALKAMNISWSKVETSTTNFSSSKLSAGWVGHTPGGLKVTLLPQGVACRGEGCAEEVRGRVYIWHHGSTRHKMETMSEKAGHDGVWFLRPDWTSAGGHMYGLKWLARISTQESSITEEV